MPDRRIRLGYFAQFGAGGTWRRPDSGIEGALGFEYWRRIVQRLEEARFDFFFRGDLLAANPSTDDAFASYFEPLTHVASLIGVTESIGLVATVSTSFTEPFNLARAMATIDHLSAGRAGWNLVTSGLGAENFGSAPLPNELERYARAEEYLEVVRDLWGSWRSDAVIVDRERGRRFDASRVHAIDHHGAHFDVAGPLNVARSPQSRPVLFQAGGSDRGRQFAASFAEVTFSASPEIEHAIRYRTDMRARRAALGLDPDGLIVMPGTGAVIARTESEVDELKAYIRDQYDLEAGRRSLAAQLGIVLSDLELDEPIPPERLVGAGEHAARVGRAKVHAVFAARDGVTLRQVIVESIATGGHWQLFGTPVQIADQLQEWFERGAADGFMLSPGTYMDGLWLFLDEVVPILAERGLVATEYEGGTFRENLGLVPIPGDARRP